MPTIIVLILCYKLTDLLVDGGTYLIHIQDENKFNNILIHEGGREGCNNLTTSIEMAPPTHHLDALAHFVS